MKPLVCILCFSALFACIRARYVEGDPLRWDQVVAIRPGETTRSEVLRRLGAPDSLAAPSVLEDYLESRGIEPEDTPRMPFEDVFTYQYTRGRVRGFFALFYNRVEMTIESDLLVIFFEDDIVTHVGYRRGGTEPPPEGEEDAL